ncbi:GNAT family N-acetyltransferase [Polaromonas sp.]|uniref:GNAT family N-acetyltransferase n=1 Tax=Polaromonas sp. TaxID=1869339 RepID=UPI0017FDBC3D|nr:GNAT family N-acetyltransferase [Polaromonas sp.]
MNIWIRIATSADLPELLALVRDVLTTSLDASAASIRSLKDNAVKNEIWADAHPDKCVHLVAAVEGAVVGVVMIKEHWNLCNLFVHPSMHRQGVGNVLLRRAVEAARGVNSSRPIELYAVPAATGFYRRIGFTPTGRSREGAEHMILEPRIRNSSSPHCAA